MLPPTDQRGAHTGTKKYTCGLPPRSPVHTLTFRHPYLQHNTDPGSDTRWLHTPIGMSRVPGDPHTTA